MKCRVVLWDMPPRSPDLNPVEKFWAWLRRRLRALDLAALQKKRKSLGKAAYQERVRSVCRSQQAQRVAAACARSFRKTCLEVVRKKGAASTAPPLLRPAQPPIGWGQDLEISQRCDESSSL